MVGTRRARLLVRRLHREAWVCPTRNVTAGGPLASTMIAVFPHGRYAVVHVQMCIHLDGPMMGVSVHVCVAVTLGRVNWTFVCPEWCGVGRGWSYRDNRQ